MGSEDKGPLGQLTASVRGRERRVLLILEYKTPFSVSSFDNFQSLSLQRNRTIISVSVSYIISLKTKQVLPTFNSSSQRHQTIPCK